MAPRERVIQSIFRKANEKLRERMDARGLDGKLPVVCECGNDDCLDVIEVDQQDYAAIRADGNFVIRSGHAIPDIEEVVEQRNGYDVVSKYESGIEQG